MGRPIEETSKLAPKGQNFTTMSESRQRQQAQNVFDDSSILGACTIRPIHTTTRRFKLLCPQNTDDNYAETAEHIKVARGGHFRCFRHSDNVNVVSGRL
jgi:hypothetical protein